MGTKPAINPTNTPTMKPINAPVIVFPPSCFAPILAKIPINEITIINALKFSLFVILSNKLPPVSVGGFIVDDEEVFNISNESSSNSARVCVSFVTSYKLTDHVPFI